MLKANKIFVAGHKGMVGSSIVRKLQDLGISEILLKSKEDLNLLDQNNVYDFLNSEKPDLIINAAAKVGGIYANDNYRAEFLFENLQIQNNLIHGAHQADIDNFVFLGSSCIYPRNCPQPIREEYLLSGYLEKTNEPYALAKIAGLKLCETYSERYKRNYFAVMPSNLYGPGDNYDPDNSHVLPALLLKMYNARKNGDKIVSIWGSGSPLREFLHVDDLSEAIIFLLSKDYRGKHINIGYGEDISIRELAEKIKKITKYDGDIIFDKSKPDGTPKKLLDISKLTNLGWKPTIKLKEGISSTYKEKFIS